MRALTALRCPLFKCTNTHVSLGIGVVQEAQDVFVWGAGVRRQHKVSTSASCGASICWLEGGAYMVGRGSIALLQTRAICCSIAHAQGRIDAKAVTDFLRDCIARRYYAGAGSSPSGLHGRGPPPPRAGSNPSTPPFSGFHETLHEHLPASARTPPQVWGSPAGGPPSITGGYGGMRGLGSRTVSYQSMASSSDYGWGSASEAGGAHGAFMGGGDTALDMNGRIDD